MRDSGSEQYSNSKHTEDHNILKGSCSVKNTVFETDINPKLDFSSEFFDPQEVLGAGDIILPFPNVTPYNNLSEYNSLMHNKMKRPRNNMDKSADGVSNSTATQNGRNQQSDSQEYDYSQELFKDKEELHVENKNKCKEGDVYYDQHRDLKNRSSDGVRRKECYSNGEGRAQKIKENRIEKNNTKHNEVSPPKNGKCEPSHNQKRNLNFFRHQENLKNSVSQSKFNAKTSGSVALRDTTKENNGEKTNHSSGNSVPKVLSAKTESYEGSWPKKEETNNHTEQQKKLPCSVSKANSSQKKYSSGSPTPKNAFENECHQSEKIKKGTEQQDRHSASRHKLPGVKPNSEELQEPTAAINVVENHSNSCSDVSVCDKVAAKNKSYNSEKRFKNNGKQEDQYSHSALKDKHRSPKGILLESQESSEGTSESEIENFRINCTSDTTIVNSARNSEESQLSEGSNETEIHKHSSDFVPQNETNKNENCRNLEMKKNKNITASKGKLSPTISDATKLQEFAEKTSKVEKHRKSVPGGSVAESSSNNNENREHSHYDKSKSKNFTQLEEKYRHSGSDYELCVESGLDSTNQHGLLEKTSNRAVEKQNKKCGGSASKNSTAQNANKICHYEKGKSESCAEEHKRETNQASRNVCSSQDPNSAELQFGKQNHQEVKEKESISDFHKGVKNLDVVAANSSTAEKLKNYKIPKLSSKNKSDGKRGSEISSIGTINEFNKSSQAANNSKKGQGEMSNINESRSIEENNLGGNVVNNKKYCHSKDQDKNWKNGNRISLMDAEKSENFKSSSQKKSARKRAGEKNMKHCTEQENGHRKEKCSMNIPVERPGISDSARKHRDDQMHPEKDFVKCHENQPCASRQYRDHYHHPSKHFGEHCRSSGIEENVHCHSKYEENPCDRSKNDRNCCDRLGSGDYHDHPKSGENCHDHSKYDHHGQCCSRYDGNCHNHSRCRDSCCDHSRSDESRHDRSRYDRRHYDRMSYSRFDHDHFRHAGKFRYHSKYDRFGRRFCGCLERDRYRRDHPKYGGNRRDFFRYGKSHHDNLKHSDSCHDMCDHPRTWERHESEDEMLPKHKEMKERVFNDGEYCHSEYDKNYTVRKAKKTKDIVGQGKSKNNNINIDKSTLKEHRRRLDYEDGEVFSDFDSDNVMGTGTVKFQTEDISQEKSGELIDQDKQIEIGEKSFKEGKGNQDHHEKFRGCGSKGGVNEAEMHSENELEVSSQVSHRNGAYRQDHLEQVFSSERMEQSDKTQFKNLKKGKGEISKQLEDNVQSLHEKQKNINLHKDRIESNEAKNTSATKPLKHGSRKRQANLLDYKGFTVTSTSKVGEESSSIIRGSIQTFTVATRAADSGDPDGKNHAYHFDRRECSNSEQMFLESTPNTQSTHNKLNCRGKFWDSSCLRNMSTEEGDQCGSESEFKEVIHQNRTLKQNGNQDSESHIQLGGNSESSDETEEPQKKHFHFCDSDSSENFSDEDNQENYGELKKQHWKVRQPHQNCETEDWRESANVSNYDLFGTLSDNDDDDDYADKQDRDLEEGQNNLNAELQNQHSRNSCNSDLFGSISDEDSWSDEVTQFENRNTEERGSSPNEAAMPNSCDRSGVENCENAGPLENLGIEEEGNELFHSVNADFNEGMSDEELKDDGGDSHVTPDINKAMEECCENVDGELQAWHIENGPGNSEVIEPLENCEETGKKSFQSGFCDFLGSVPDEKLPPSGESLCPSKNLENTLEIQNVRLPHNKDMDSIKNSQLSKDDSCGNVDRVVNNEDSEENSSVKESVTLHEVKQKNDRDVIYQNIKLLKQNATNDCVCKCHSHCGENETNGKHVAIIRTYHNKSTQVNFDTDENCKDHINTNIVQVKISFHGDQAFTEDYKKSVLHDNVNTLLVKCHGTCVRNVTASVEGKENKESEQAEKRSRLEVSLELSKGKRKRSCAETDVTVREARKRRRIKNYQFLEDE